MLNTTAKQAANAETSTARWKHRDEKNKNDKNTHEDKRNDKKPTGGKGKHGRGDMPAIIEPLGLEVGLKHGQFRVTEQRVQKLHVIAKEITEAQLGCEGEDLACGVVGSGVVVETTSDEQVERSQHLETTDESEEISTQLPRYYATWKDPRCEGVDLLTYDWQGENNWVNPPWALLDEVAHKLREEGAAATVVVPYWPSQSWFTELEALVTEVVIMPRHRDLFTLSGLGGSELLGPSKWDAVMFFIQSSPLEVFWVGDDKFYPGVVKSFNKDSAAHVVYDDGDEETLNLSEEKFNILHSAGVYEQNTERGGDYEENKRGGATQNFFVRLLYGQWRDELGQSDFTNLAILMQRRWLLDSTLSNYGLKAEKFVKFCAEAAVHEENIVTQRTWLPA
ncbi:hypothetical protein CYMTET_51114 [Cymbomonas tetramitiformis]|uniref:Uncharacterized protein n=1 Tax=Cymbomonas tetramitiformis TaxID=36881 RepID=A0AAE0BNG1_9CHLO|nr:hypothetical protein CYMTET_51114 [Cymbomonas tetramitiformis]